MQMRNHLHALTRFASNAIARALPPPPRDAGHTLGRPYRASLRARLGRSPRRRPRDRNLGRIIQQPRVHARRRNPLEAATRVPPTHIHMDAAGEERPCSRGSRQNGRHPPPSVRRGRAGAEGAARIMRGCRKWTPGCRGDVEVRAPVWTPSSTACSAGCRTKGLDGCRADRRPCRSLRPTFREGGRVMGWRASRRAVPVLSCAYTAVTTRDREREL